MSLTNAEKIRVLTKRKKVTMVEIAALLGVSRQGLYNKLNSDDFKREDLEKVAAHLGVQYESNFVLEDGTKI